jgi:hypothetical protein
MSDMSDDTSQTFLSNFPKINPKLTNASASTSSSSSSSSSFNSSSSSIFNKTILKNKYVRAILYIILIFYASVIAPRLPDWLIPYLQNSIVKILIFLIICLLATEDPIAAFIAAIGAIITYLFIAENKLKNNINNIFNTEEDNENCVQSKELLMNIEHNNTIHNIEHNIENNIITRNIENFNTTRNIEHFNTKNENTIHNVEYFDVLNNNNSYINHIEEHF